MQDMILDTLKDSLKLFPFLFITYLAMEYIEHKAGSRAQRMMERSGKWGPVFGGTLGVVPQCGFSAAASNLYAGRIISLGTLLAVFLSTSDEMLPVLISEKVSPITIARILAVKAVIGILMGSLADWVIGKIRGKRGEELRIGQMCEEENCHCSEGKIFQSALRHSLQIFAFIAVVSFLVSLVVSTMGEERLAVFFSGRAVVGPAVAGLVGLIPNCASSVILTQFYLEGMLSAGALIAGLLSGSGAGLLVLFRVNDDLGENVKITLLLYAIGLLSGVVIEITGLTF